jgi:hypothetical protein
MPRVPDPYAHNRRITKAFDSMDPAKRLEQLNLPKLAIQQLAEQWGVGGRFGLTTSNRAALEAGAGIGRNTDFASRALRSIGVGRTFDLTSPRSPWDDLAYNRRITKAFDSMNAVVGRFDQRNFPKTRVQQIAESHGLSGLSGLTTPQRAAIEAGATIDQVFSPAYRTRIFPGFQDFVERAKSASSLLLRRERVEEELIETDPVGARLTVVLGHMGVGRALDVMELMLAEGRNALLALLGRVLLSPEALDVFSRAVDEAPLSAHVELDLRHALEHLAEGDTDRAFPALITGLEGALRDSARTCGAKKPKNALGAAAVLKMEKGHQHLIGAVYKVANDGRHGEDMDREIGCVLGLVGLVIWMNDCLDQPAVKWLGLQLDQALLSTPA